MRASPDIDETVTCGRRYQMSSVAEVAMGAVLQCSFGASPSQLSVLPARRVDAEGMPAATIMDHQPMVHIAPFGMCSSIANPSVASATAAAMGALTPMPCMPATMSPWTPGVPAVVIAGEPVLDKTSTCMCNWGGVISITDAGTKKTFVP
jgi:hypothetical protein